MSVNIQDLLGTLFQSLANENLRPQTKTAVTSAHQHFLTLQNSKDKQQARMISTFLGTLIHTIHVEGWAPDQTKEFTGFYQSSTADQYEVMGNQVLAALSDPEKRKSLTDLFITIIYADDKKMQDQIKYLMEFCALNLENLEKPTFTPSNYRKEVEKNSYNMVVLGGFMLALGITAVAIAFVVLNISTLGGALVLGAGIGAMLVGQGIFCLKDKKLPSIKDCFTNADLEERISVLENKLL